MTTEQIQQIQTAVALQRAGRLAEAAKIYSRVLRRAPDNFDCIYLLATLHAQQGDLSKAIELFRRAAKLRPDVLDVQYNLAVALSMTGDHREAARAYKRILDKDPRHSQARNNYAACLLSDNQLTEALQQYDALIASYPDHADAYNNRGMALQYLKRLDEALRSYDQAIALRPRFPQSHVNRGNVLAMLHRPDDALESFRKAIALQPDFADAYSNAGNIYSTRRDYGAALGAYDRALALRPDDSETRSMRLLAKMYLCDWNNFDAECRLLLEAVAAAQPVYPFSMLPVSTKPAEQYRCAKTFTEARYSGTAPSLRPGAIQQHARLRIGYVSSDFREHAVANLAAGMFEHHDKTRFSVTAISIGPDDGSALRRRLQNAFDAFIDAGTLRDDEIAARVKDAEIDILIDLNGYTHGARMGIFAQRPAPLQVGYLGYSGTVGADYIDYVIADATVIPERDFACFSEKVVWLPGSFMVNDAARPIADGTPTRAELQLPDGAFVFCCFNQPYKIGPDVFDVWMRLLRAVDGSVLWLKENGAEASRNLRREAEERGVAPERLIFAASVPLAADHLARQRQADLFLDTLPYNAHATTADALWAGLPVVTCRGETFAGRVASSLLKAAGLDELITASLDDYEAMALKLARDPSLLAAFKSRLLRNRNTCSLFDTARFTRSIEAAYTRMWQMQQSGERPASFAVQADD
jgi:predicted O-linked N-acetylglucosamine transferase (SPINDLY family)